VTKAKLLRSAWWLKEWARALRASETTAGGTKWTSLDAKEEHDEMLELAKELRAHARSLSVAVSEVMTKRRSA
jgi:hypothetical protein